MEKNLVTEIGSALEYMLDRGEFDERLERIITTTRYTDEEVDCVDVVWDGKKVRITCKVVPWRKS